MELIKELWNEKDIQEFNRYIEGIKQEGIRMQLSCGERGDNC